MDIEGGCSVAEHEDEDTFIVGFEVGVDDPVCWDFYGVFRWEGGVWVDLVIAEDVIVCVFHHITSSSGVGGVFRIIVVVIWWGWLNGTGVKGFCGWAG